MKDIIIIKNMLFKYDEKSVFDNFNLSISRGTFSTIIGSNGSGKSTLMRILVGLEKADGYINIDGLLLNEDNLPYIRKKIGVVFENPDNQFVAETVMDDIAFSLENINIHKKDIRKRVKEVAELLDIDHLLNSEPHRLSGGEKQLVALASALIIKPSILILDEAFTMVDNITKDHILKILKQQNEDNNLTIINISHDIEDTLYGNNIIIIDNGKLIDSGSLMDIYSKEDLFKNLNISLPFIVDLSIKLQFYELIDKMILNMEDMVNALWK